MYKVIHQTEATARQIADNYVAHNYITKEFSPGVSLAVNDATGYYEKLSTKYNRVYYIIEGELFLTFDGEQVRMCAGDSCYIAKDTIYEMRGTFKAVLVNQPAFGT